MTDSPTDRPAPTREQITDALNAFLPLTGVEAHIRLERDADFLLHPDAETMLREEAATARAADDVEYADLLEARARRLAARRASQSAERGEEDARKAELAFLLIELQSMQSTTAAARGRPWLERRVELCEAVLERQPRETNLPVWATIQGALGNASSALGEITGDPAWFGKAETAHLAALSARPRLTAPEEWAKSQDNLGVTLTQWAAVNADRAALARAEEAFLAALEHWSGSDTALRRAGVLAHLGVALRMTNEPRALARAEAALREAVALLGSDRDRIEWIAAKNALGQTLHMIGAKGDRRALDEAETHYRDALGRCDREQHASTWGALQHNLGAVLEASGDGMNDANRLRDAVVAYSAALSARDRSSDPIEWAKSQNNFGNIWLRIGELEGDLPALRKSQAAFEAALEALGGDRAPLLRGAALHNLAGLRRSIAALTGDLDEAATAEELYLEALRLRPRGEVPQEWASTQAELGAWLRALGEAASDIEVLRRSEAACRCALLERERSARPREWAISQSSLGSTLAAIGACSGDIRRLNEAKACHERALDVLDRKHAPVDWAMVQNNLGNVLSALGEWLGDAALLRAAEIAFQSSLEERKRGRAPMEWAATQNNLGVLLEALGALNGEPDVLRRAAAAYREALEERARHREPAQWAGTQNNLGAVLLRLGEATGDASVLREAEAAFRKALDLQPRDRFPMAWARTQNNLGVVLAMLGEREEDAHLLAVAAKAYGAALEERTVEKTPMDWAATQNNLGAALARLADATGDAGRLREAEAAIRGALTVRTREHSPIEWARTQYNLARILDRHGAEDEGELREAESACRNALAVFGASADEENAQITSVALARLLSRLKRWDDALPVIDAALAKSDAALADAARSRDGAMRMVEITSDLHALKSVSLLRRPGGDAAEALAAAEAGRIRLFADGFGVEDNFDLAARPSLTAALERAHALRRRLGAGESFEEAAPRRPPPGDRAEIERELRQVVDSVEKIRRPQGGARAAPTLDPAYVASAAPDGGAFIMPVLTERDAFAFVLSSGQRRPNLVELPGLDRRVAATHLWRRDGGWLRVYREHFVEPRARAREAAAAWRGQIETTSLWLWERLMGPIHRHLSVDLGLPAGAPVVLSPPGLLGVLPLCAAAASPEDLCFDDLWTMTVAPNLRAHRLCRNRLRLIRERKPRLLAVVDPLRADSVEPLPSAAREEAMLRERFIDGDVLILPGRAATLSATFEELRGATHVHVSSHGEHDPVHPLRSGIRLADGDLRIDMLRDLDLPMTPLVFLASCESGLAEIQRAPDEFLGLPLAFIRAGAAGVVASLWPVRDEAALELAGRFYERHFGGGGDAPLSAPAALRAARAALRRDPRFRSPEHWAAFVMFS
jgi:tetratricopeptide (TPR) repeat protein